MASSIIHIAVANEINKELNKDKSKILIGTIAPDISKHIGEPKVGSHFLIDPESGIPNIQKFLDKYKNNLTDDFVMGYFIHLYTDYLWFKYFIPEFIDTEKITVTKKDGTTIKCSLHLLDLFVYNDYSNINNSLIDEYDLDLKIFYEEVPKLDNIIEEIPMDRIDIIVNKTGIIIENSKETKELTFGMDEIKQFISMCVKIISEEINRLNIC
ncbi:MAG: hypothetical protein J1F35_03020 [Erysipelotrichales bacterium]|nr:hypothetical protein [Erysipelotrichales bacterium]